MSNDELKLIYVLKAGKNSRGEGIYEFIFSYDIENVDVEMWNWDESPAIENKDILVPTMEYIDAIYSFTTKKFNLVCLHDAVDRSYMHGYYLIHALAYEDFEGEDEEGSEEEYDFEDLMNEEDETLYNEPILVFHYGTTLKDVEARLYERNIMLKVEKSPKKKSVKK